MHLEIMDNRCVRRTRIATIDKLTGGGRISVKYFVSTVSLRTHPYFAQPGIYEPLSPWIPELNSTDGIIFQGSEETFACHIRSPVAHPMGWSKEVGHDIFEYDDELVNDLKQNAVPSELFNQVSLLVI